MDNLIIFGAKYLIAAVLLLYALAFFQPNKRHRKELIVSLILAGIIAAILDKLGGHLFYDPRPFVNHAVKPLINHSADNGFPSEHTILGVTVGTLLIYYRRRLGAAALLVAIIVGISRVLAHVHSPIDIIGGAVIGIVAGSLGYWLTPKIIKPPKHPA